MIKKMQKPPFFWIKTQFQLILPQQLHETHKKTSLVAPWLKLGTSCNHKINPRSTSITVQQAINKQMEKYNKLLIKHCKYKFISNWP